MQTVILNALNLIICLAKKVLAKNGKATIPFSMIENLDLDFSYNYKNYKSAISDLYNQLQDLYERAEITIMLTPNCNSRGNVS